MENVVVATVQISLSLLELRIAQEQAEPLQRPITPVQSSPLRSGENPSMEKDELSALKAGLRKVKILTGLSNRRAKKEEEQSEGSDDAANPFDSESIDEFEEGESDDGKDDESTSVRKSFSYNPLAHANIAGGGSYYSHSRHKSENEDWVSGISDYEKY